MGRAAAVALGCYGALVVLCTWPLAAHLGTHLPLTIETCRFDLRQMIWALAWQTHALTTDPGQFFEANVYHPTPHALLYADAGYGALPFFMPTMLATGNPILAANVMILVAITLTVWGLHVVVTRWTGFASAGFVAAGMLLTNRWLLWWWGPAAPNYVVLPYYPVVIALAAGATLAGWRAVLLAVVVALQGVVSPYLAVPILATLGLLGCWRCAHAATRRDGCRLLVALAAAATVIGLVYLPNFWWLRTLEPGLAGQSPWQFMRRIELNVPLDWFVGFANPTTTALPLLALIGAGVVLRRVHPQPSTPGERQAWRNGWLWAMVGFALMVTPRVRVLGYSVALPHAALMDRLPGLDLLRSIQRLGVGALFGMALLAGAAFGEIAVRLQRFGAPWVRVLRPGLAIALVVTSGFGWADATRFSWVPVGGTTMAPWRAFPIVAAAIPDSPIRSRLAGETGPLLVVDLARGRGHAIDAQAMFESIGHWQPIVNGYGGFHPAGYPQRMRLAQQLPSERVLSELLQTTHVAWILVHGKPEHARMPAWEKLERRRDGEGLQFMARVGNDLLFRVVGAMPAAQPGARSP
jgi:hypothetical protein